MILFVMTLPSPNTAAASPAGFRLDPSPSKVFSWLEWSPDASALFDEVTDREYNFSIGSAFADLIKGQKSSRQVKSGERQETRKQRAEIEQRAGRRWLA